MEDKAIQQDLGFHTGVPRKPMDSARHLKDMIDDLALGVLQIPEFQRDPCWDDQKIKEWCETIISQQAIGSIVTYQIQGQGPQFLADGLQRLTATRRFLKHPQAYGFNFGPSIAEEYCRAFFLPIQHRHYNDHEEAMQAFQNLNKGTITTPAEFHKGEMTLNPIGKYIYDKLPNLVTQVGYSLTFNQYGGRETRARLRRDAFVLFWQYITGTESINFCKVNQIQTDGSSIESKLMEYIEREKWTQSDVDSQLRYFEQFLQSAFAMIVDVLREQGQEEKAFSKTLLRALFHLAIWRKNTKRSVEKHLEFLTRLFEHLSKYPSMTSRSEVEGEDGKMVSVQIALSNISRFRVLDNEAFGIGLFDEPEKRLKSNTRPGYDRSHVLPFINHGEGEAFSEPASLNRARGAKPITA